jgi:hypothetical protein
MTEADRLAGLDKKSSLAPVDEEQEPSDGLGVCVDGKLTMIRLGMCVSVFMSVCCVYVHWGSC